MILPCCKKGKLERLALRLAYWTALSLLALFGLAAPGEARQTPTIASGNGHNLGILADGTVAAWGDNFLGQCTMPAGLNLKLRLKVPAQVQIAPLMLLLMN